MLLPPNHTPKISREIFIKTTLVVIFVNALGFFFLGKDFWWVVGFFILVIFVISMAITSYLFIQKKKQIRYESREKITNHNERMQNIMSRILAADSITPLRSLDQASRNHFLAYILSHWNYRADVVETLKINGHGGNNIDIWLYRDNQQGAVIIDNGDTPISQQSLQNMCHQYLGRPDIFGTYITLGAFESAAQEWADRECPTLWLIDGPQLVSIIRKTKIE